MASKKISSPDLVTCAFLVEGLALFPSSVLSFALLGAIRVHINDGLGVGVAAAVAVAVASCFK